ncbi:MAG: chromosome segregation ATPase [Moorea sp. SIOASIH]|uniref:chromosome segregation ATPase n=1 Tax=Moorena sp. SIOASIH TaxID=2607817 RepID=UPI0013B8554F|nr:chromosome segregation ATPase [Moorena sp. SIOASIH]NEO40954.1 chromosome segregation ATPase [Moorena sp. SIOASIH]
MTRNREFPDRWPTSNGSSSGKFNGWQPNQSEPVTQPSVNYPDLGTPSTQPPQQSEKFGVGQPVANSGLNTAQTTPRQGRSAQATGVKNLLPRSWQFWSALVVLLFGSAGFASAMMLLRLPAVPNCRAVFWPTASASMRLSCAQVAANQETVPQLLKAIALVDALPEDHPLRPQVNQYIEEWSHQILEIGEAKFQAGQLSEALKIAKRIPSKSVANPIVKKRVKRWQKIWSRAEEVYEQAEKQLRLSNWNLAFREAVRLTYVDNDYWATAKYNQLTDKIKMGREDSAKLDKAYELSRSGNIEKILAAIKKAKEITDQSYAYKEAQDLIKESGNKLVEIAQNKLEQGKWSEVLDIAYKLPETIKVPELKSDLIDLAHALSRAESGTTWDLEEAIASAQKLGSERPLYKKGQQLISRWQREVEDVARLERARTYATSGLASDLRLAVAEVEQIPRGNPRYQEARGEIRDWTRQIQLIEDRPFLERATQLASYGSIDSLQAAVQEAGKISRGRSLYQEAQTKINQWSRSIQQQEDQPYLDQARTLAIRGDLYAAVATAEQIKAGRALYNEAQSKVRSWKLELEGQQRLREAYQIAEAGTPQALRKAIRVARQVPTSTKSRSEARTVVNRWSYKILSIARSRSAYNVSEAIAIANIVPSGTRPYQEAQRQMQSWRKILAPPPPPPVPVRRPRPVPVPSTPQVVTPKPAPSPPSVVKPPSPPARSYPIVVPPPEVTSPSGIVKPPTQLEPPRFNPPAGRKIELIDTDS